MSEELTIGQVYFKQEGIIGIGELLSYFPERLQPNIIKAVAEVYNDLYNQLTVEEKDELESVRDLANRDVVVDNYSLRNNLEQNIKEKETKLESYVSGYYSIEATKDRFKSLPHCLETALIDHELQREELEADISSLREELANLDKQCNINDEVSLFN
jgi:predicted nuclease with TOPRIM domain